MDGATLQGIGTLCGGVAALGGFLFVLIKGHRIFEFVRDRTIIIGERDEARSIAEREKAVRIAAEAAATNWRESANGAQFDLESMEKRIATLERRDREREALFAEREAIFAEVVAYARDILEWVVRAEQIASLGGVQLVPAPPIPDTLSHLLQMPRPPAAQIEA